MYKLYCGDCVKVMRQKVVDESVQLTVTSPPYDNLRIYKGFTWNFEETAQELYRVTKPGGVVVWVVGDATIKGSETCTSFRQALYFKECGFNLHDTMIYEKAGTGAVGSNYTYFQTWEYMFVFSKGKLAVCNLLYDRKNQTAGGSHSHGRGKQGDCSKDKKYRITPEFGRRTNIWRYGVSGFQMESCYRHPAKFPFKLAEDHILSWSNQQDLILDPMCGSGTTGKMAVFK